MPRQPGPNPPTTRLRRISILLCDLVATGGLTTLAPATLMLGWLMGRDQATRPVRRRFLPVAPPQRPGTPSGCGTVSSRRFDGSSAPHS